jgi:Plasmid pRiA4b ORF-3-like protein
MAKPTTVYQLKVTLKQIRPAIWRRLQVSSDITLSKLHHVLQDALGWTDSHLHQFVLGERRIGMKGIDDYSDGVEDERRVKLSQIAAAKSRFVYEYDFGDSWEHELLVEKVLPPVDGIRYPICVAGTRACPPEDCGGAGGYQRLLEIIADPGHEEHDEMTDWLDGPFHPEAFDLDATNLLLQKSRNPRNTSAFA